MFTHLGGSIASVGHRLGSVPDTLHANAGSFHNDCVWDGDWLNYSKDPTGGKYTGTVREGRRHGFGVCWYKNGDVYEGEWKQGVQSHVLTQRTDLICLVPVFELMSLAVLSCRGAVRGRQVRVR